MEPVIKVRENIVVLVLSLIGALCIIAGVAFFCVMAYLAGEMDEAIVLCSILFSPLLLGCCIGVVCYFKRRLELYQGYLVYYPMFRRKKVISYYEIKSVVCSRERIFLIDAQGEVLARFEDNMDGSTEALKYLKQYIGKENPVDIPKEIKKKEERRWNPLRNSDFIASRWSEEQIEKEKAYSKVIRYICAGLTIAVIILPLDAMGRRIFSVFMIYFVFGMYLFYYPKMIFDESRACDEYHMPFPMVAFGGSVFMLVKCLQTSNIGFSMWMIMAVVFAFILLAIYGIVLWTKKIKERIPKILLVALSSFVISVYTSPAIYDIVVSLYSH